MQDGSLGVHHGRWPTGLTSEKFVESLRKALEGV